MKKQEPSRLKQNFVENCRAEANKKAANEVLMGTFHLRQSTEEDKKKKAATAAAPVQSRSARIDQILKEYDVFQNLRDLYKKGARVSVLFIKK